ncbi:hypothetical protein RB195_020808 [Necator americanus]|uniref:Cysteine rich repeat-containing domain protein n=1 Tax=Necator americanus TaxID=51031 RepID=A0ABR1CMM0_NECAM
MTEHPVGKKRLDCCCPVSLAINASVGKLFIISTATMCTAFALGLILLVTLTEQTSVTRTKRQCPCAYFPPSSCSCRASLTPRCTCVRPILQPSCACSVQSQSSLCRSSCQRSCISTCARSSLSSSCPSSCAYTCSQSCMPQQVIPIRVVMPKITIPTECLPVCQQNCRDSCSLILNSITCNPLCKQSCVNKCVDVIRVLEQNQLTIKETHVSEVPQCSTACMPLCAPQCVQEQNILVQEPVPALSPVVLPSSQCTAACMPNCAKNCVQEQQPSVNQPVVFTNPFATADILPQQPAIGQEPSLLPDNISTLSPQLQEVFVGSPTMSPTQIATGQPQQSPLDIPFLMPGPVSTGTSQPQLQEVPTTQPTLVSEQGAGEVTQSSIFVTPPSLIPGPISPGAPFPQDATINQVIIDGLAAASSQSQQLNQGASTFPINSIQTPGQLQCVPACMPKCDPQCILEQELLQYDWSQMATGTTPQPKSVGIRPLKVNIVMDDPSQSYPKCKYGCAQQCAQQCGMRSDQEYCLKMCENSCEKSCLSKA